MCVIPYPGEIRVVYTVGRRRGDGDALEDQGRLARTSALLRGSRWRYPLHRSSLATLDDVVEFYDRGGRPNPNLDPDIRALGLTVEEKQALLAFLGSLSGTRAEGDHGSPRNRLEAPRRALKPSSLANRRR